MCGRFCIAVSPGELKERYGIRPDPSYTPRYSISPGQEILVITGRSPSRRGQLARWGIPRTDTGTIINARLESLRTRHHFRDLFPANCCLVPASGYYEWKKEKSLRIPYYFFHPETSLLSFAGMYRCGPAGMEIAILTTTSVAPSYQIHDRMPVILAPGGEDAYLQSGATDVLQDQLSMRRVSTRVNQPGAEGPDLIREETPRSVQALLEGTEEG